MAYFGELCKFPVGYQSLEKIIFFSNAKISFQKKNSWAVLKGFHGRVGPEAAKSLISGDRIFGSMVSQWMFLRFPYGSTVDLCKFHLWPVNIVTWVPQLTSPQKRFTLQWWDCGDEKNPWDRSSEKQNHRGILRKLLKMWLRLHGIYVLLMEEILHHLGRS